MLIGGQASISVLKCKLLADCLFGAANAVNLLMMNFGGIAQRRECKDLVMASC